MNAIPKLLNPVDHSLDAVAAELASSDARRRSLQRTLQALFREALLNRDQLITEGAVSWLPLWAQQGMLRFEGLSLGRIGDCRLAGGVSYYATGERPQPVAHASALLACVAPSLPGRGADLQRLIHELDNSLANDVLCLSYRRGWARALRARLGRAHDHFIAALRTSSHANPALLLEQWGTLGHPWHPTFKTKLGLSADEVTALSPEFQPTLSVPLGALRADKAHVTFSTGDGDYLAWFGRHFPQPLLRWKVALAALGKSPADWVPLPLHPFQASRVIPEKFAAEIARGDLLLPDDVVLDATPTMSFRTVVPAGSPTLPHLKLPVSLRLTSVQRTVSPKSAVMGPRITRLLATILDAEAGFDGTLDIVREDVGLYYLDPDGDDDRARHLAILYRANPMARADGERFPVPVGALFAESPFSGRPLATEVVALAYGDHAAGAVACFERHARTVLTALLSAYLVYGIAFEAHQQNSFIMLDADYAPVQLLARDFGDLRIHGPTLRAAGLAIDPYRAGFTVYEDDEPVRDKLLHAVLLCHLSELALLLARAYGHPEHHFWDVLRREIEAVFAAVRPRVDAARWHAERQALLEHDWPAKAFLRMRLSDTQDDVHGTMPNPLA
ncbi:IucA/IucC family siderophore biosynthesis protein [Telluria mixta]|uniref:IucA/IucC family siderophore biosynthesis protein n=1 Tax=Telluria mixta TaxID=34071 RepID=A0ABT2BU36_9BURK|nr:IucA/IucC family protein [Telluria mixta]MCS0628642.1 IucA/IucC family siderophore biosynthesis protein [Telluria mixta]WEM93258.1 IucA/IucC family protein [Telluria mixta]